MKTILLASGTILLPVAAFAQTAVPTASNAWTPVLANSLITMATVAVPAISAALVGVLVQWFRKAGLDVSAGESAAIESKLTTALNVGISQASEIISTTGWNGQAAKDQILADANSYLRQHFPDAAGAITAAASTPNKGSAVTTALAARLPAVALDAAASPATPPKP